MTETDNYTLANFKEMKKALELNNQDVANIIGTTRANVDIQTAPNKKVPSWGKVFIYMYKRLKTD